MSEEFWSGRLVPVHAAGRTFMLQVRDVGPRDAPAVLFLHGFPTSSLDWSKVAPYFEDRRAIYVDLLGFGRSDKPDVCYSYELQADLIAALLHTLGLRKVDIVAHDYAVTLVQEMLRREVDLPVDNRTLDRIVLLNGGVYGRLHRQQRFHRLLLTPIVGRMFASRLNSEAMVKGLNAIAGPGGGWTRSDVENHMQDMKANDGLRRLPDLMHYIADRERYGVVWEPVMEAEGRRIGFVWGLADPVSGNHVLAEVRRRMPSSAIREIDVAGHYPHWEVPVLTAQAILGMLS